MAKMKQMTEEQRNIIAESKAGDISNLDKDKLKEAEALAAQIEAESFSKYDQDFEKKNRNKYTADTLTDDQLVDLFSEMKKETMAKREEKMKKFKIEAPADGGLDLIDEFNDELEAMRGEDSPAEDGGGIGRISAVGKVGVAVPFGSLEDEALEEEEPPAVKYFNDDVREQLKRYREQKALEQNRQSVESNL